MTERFGDGRYRICDEPRHLGISGKLAPLMLFLLPITLWLALSFSIFFLLLPGAFGVALGGPHRWRDPLLCVIALVIYFAIALVFGLALNAGLGDVLAAYFFAFHLALTVAPLFAVIMGQHRTLQMRAAIEG